MRKIVTIGGGTGAPVIVQALLQAGYQNISCLCASMDSGGKTGIIRSDERDQVIAISDLLPELRKVYDVRRSLLQLAFLIAGAALMALLL